MDRVQALLAMSAGEVSVYLHIPEEKITLLSPREYWSSGEEAAVRRLKEALGEDNVVLK